MEIMIAALSLLLVGLTWALCRLVEALESRS
jgi:hypothetical protein